MSGRGAEAVLLWVDVLTGQVVSFSLIVCCAPTEGSGREAINRKAGSELSLLQLASLISLPEVAATLGFAPFLFNQSTWKGHSVGFSHCTNLTDVTIKFALPLWSPKSRT